MTPDAMYTRGHASPVASLRAGRIVCRGRGWTNRRTDGWTRTDSSRASDASAAIGAVPLQVGSSPRKGVELQRGLRLTTARAISWIFRYIRALLAIRVLHTYVARTCGV